MNLIKSENFRKCINSLFFFILTLLIVLSFDIKTKAYSDITGFVSKFHYYILSFAITLGTMFVFLNRKKINDIIENDRIDYKNEQKKNNEFPANHPKLNRIPVINILARFIYKQGGIYSFAFFSIIVFSFFFLSYNLGSADLYQDEYQVVATAEGYFHSGTFYQWDYINNKLSDHLYNRAWPHSWMIAQSYKLFGITEWSSRIVSVLFGVFFVTTFYFIAKYFTQNKLVALLSILCPLLHPELIRLFRYARMYAVLIPIFTLLFFCLYRFFTEENRYDFKRITPFINKNISYNYFFLLPCLILLIFNYLIHINSFILFPIIYLFILFLANFLQTRKYIIPVIVGAVIIFTVKITENGIIEKVKNYTTFFEMKNFAYLDYLTGYPFNPLVTFILLFTGLALFFIVKKEMKIRILYLYITIAFSLIFFIFIANRYVALKYTSPVLPIGMMLSIYLTLLFSRVSGKKWLTAVFALLWIFGSLNFSSRYFETNFGNKHISFGNPSTAYKTLIDRYNPDNEVIFGQYLRCYYLQDIGDKARIINMLSRQQYKFNTFWKDINTYGAGWVVFESRKKPHIDNKILNYMRKFFKKVHGSGIDKTNIEMYNFNKNMINESINYFKSRNIAK